MTVVFDKWRCFNIRRLERGSVGVIFDRVKAKRFIVVQHKWILVLVTVKVK